MQTTAWIRFEVEVEDGDGDAVRGNTVKKAFNSRMMEEFQGSEIDEIIEQMFAHIKKIRNWPIAGLCSIESYF